MSDTPRMDAAAERYVANRESNWRNIFMHAGQLEQELNALHAILKDPAADDDGPDSLPF